MLLTVSIFSLPFLSVAFQQLVLSFQLVPSFSCNILTHTFLRLVAFLQPTLKNSIVHTFKTSILLLYWLIIKIKKKSINHFTRIKKLNSSINKKSAVIFFLRYHPRAFIGASNFITLIHHRMYSMIAPPLYVRPDAHLNEFELLNEIQSAVHTYATLFSAPFFLFLNRKPFQNFVGPCQFDHI